MKRVILILAMVFTAANLLVAMSINVTATATCESTDGKDCSGECCLAWYDGCWGGSCDLIIPE